MKLTEKYLEKLKPESGKSGQRVQHLDDEVTGFGVRIESEQDGGRKSFFWRAKLNGQGVFRAIGEFPAVSVGNARNEAKRLVGIAAGWKSRDYAPPNPFDRKPRSAPSAVPTFRELAEAYIAIHLHSADEDERANNPEKAEYQVRWMLKRHFSEWLDRKLNEITVEEMLAVKNACGTHKYLANRAVEFIRALYNWSAETSDERVNFWPTENPAKSVKCHKEKPRTRFLQPDELVRFNETLKEETHADLKDFLIMAITTGARRGDVFSARWQDIQWERAVWTIPYPKSGEAYDVQLMATAVEVLKRRRTHAPETATYVFPGVGRSGHLVDLKGPWNDFRKKAQIPDIRLHDLRHTAASYMAMSGASLLEIKKALGHKSLQSTEVYAHLLGESVRDARETGQAKMQEMMRAAKRRAKLTVKPKRLLAAKAS
jgi:integrase